MRAWDECLWPAWPAAVGASGVQLRTCPQSARVQLPVVQDPQTTYVGLFLSKPPFEMTRPTFTPRTMDGSRISIWLAAPLACGSHIIIIWGTRLRLLCFEASFY